jgi:hypothetical protein
LKISRNGIVVVFSRIADLIKTYLMKNVLGIIIAVILLSNASNFKVKSGIQGSIDPPDGAKRMWAISTRDTVPIVPNTSGVFLAEVKPGAWKLVVEARPPYSNTERDNIVVADGQVTDIGIIKLGEQ